LQGFFGFFEPAEELVRVGDPLAAGLAAELTGSPGH
jgi:hypothetical protein